MSTTAQEPNYLAVKRGIGSWLVTLDHKRIGVMYLAGILTALLVGGAFALLVQQPLGVIVGKVPRPDRVEFQSGHG